MSEFTMTASFLVFRKSLSWHTALRIRRKSEKREGRKMENGYRKSQDGLANKVSVKVQHFKIFFYKPNEFALQI